MARLASASPALQAANSFAPKSGFIENAKYDAHAQKLTLTFKSGGEYVYQNFSPATWTSFQQSPDPSSFYANAIKKTSIASPVYTPNIGSQKSNPLQTKKQERTLDDPRDTTQHGIDRSQKRAGLEGAGTVPMPSTATSGQANGDLAGDGHLPRQAAGAYQQELKDDRDTIKALLNEARNTKTVLVDFESAIKNGTFRGFEMMAIAKGLSFVGAIINQNKAHIDNLQMRLEKSK